MASKKVVRGLVLGSYIYTCVVYYVTLLLYCLCVVVTCFEELCHTSILHYHLDYFVTEEENLRLQGTEAPVLAITDKAQYGHPIGATTGEWVAHIIRPLITSLLLTFHFCTISISTEAGEAFLGSLLDRKC